jgi:hypothetical protein
MSEDRGIDVPELPPLIPEGEYHFKLVSHETAMKFGTPRVILLMAVIDPGEHHGAAVSCYRNVKRLKGKPGKRGGFVPTRGGHFMIEFCKLLPDFNPRIDRISLSKFYDKVIYARTKTVKHNNLREKLPGQLWWTKVDKLLELREELPT